MSFERLMPPSPAPDSGRGLAAAVSRTLESASRMAQDAMRILSQYRETDVMLADGSIGTALVKFPRPGVSSSSDLWRITKKDGVDDAVDVAAGVVNYASYGASNPMPQLISPCTPGTINAATLTGLHNGDKVLLVVTWVKISYSDPIAGTAGTLSTDVYVFGTGVIDKWLATDGAVPVGDKTTSYFEIGSVTMTDGVITGIRQDIDDPITLTFGIDVYA